MCTCVCVLCESQDNVQELIFFFGHVGFGSSDGAASVFFQGSISLSLTLDHHVIELIYVIWAIWCEQSLAAVGINT